MITQLLDKREELGPVVLISDAQIVQFGLVRLQETIHVLEPVQHEDGEVLL